MALLVLGTAGCAGGPPTEPVPTPAAPATRSAAYLMPLDNAPPDISLAMASTGLRRFTLAFVLDSGGCTPAWDGRADRAVETDTVVARLIAKIRAEGGDVAVAFGGFNGTELGASCANAAELARAYQSVIDRYALTRIDLDYEGDDLGRRMEIRMAALRLLADRADAAGRSLHLTLTVPATPHGIADGGLVELRAARRAGVEVDLVNVMAFDLGGGTVEMVKTVMAGAVGQLRTVRPNATATHLGLQVMNGRTDDAGELFTSGDVAALVAHASTMRLGQVSYWSLNRDRPCPTGAAPPRAVGTCSGVAQAPFDFGRTIGRYAWR